MRIAAWLRSIAAGLEPRGPHQNTDPSPRPTQTFGPPAHWVERVRQVAPQLLEPGPPNYRAGQIPGAPSQKPEPAEHTSASAASKPAVTRSFTGEVPARSMLATLKAWWPAFQRHPSPGPRVPHQELARDIRSEVSASYPSVAGSRPAPEARYQALRSIDPPPAKDAPTAPLPPVARPTNIPQLAVRPTSRAPAKRLPPPRLEPGPRLARTSHPGKSSPLAVAVGAIADSPVQTLPNPARARLEPVLAQVPQAASQRDNGHDVAVPEKHAACDSFPSSSEPPHPSNLTESNYAPLPQAAAPVSSIRFAEIFPKSRFEKEDGRRRTGFGVPPSGGFGIRPPEGGTPNRSVASPASSPPSIPWKHDLVRPEERERAERWPALPTLSESRVREEWQTDRLEEHHRRRLDLEQRGLLWTA
ncbi:MAG: hypothetical protein L0Z50_01920 [Verrucomicrobiales bacterium]|nr:hypothetical protein [Verrucomicrobiales bacterium]